MDLEQAQAFAEEVLAETQSKEIVVTSLVLYKKKDQARANRRVDRLCNRLYALVRSRDHAAARELARTTVWEGPPRLWWCDGLQSLAVVLLELGEVVRRQNKSCAWGCCSWNECVGSMYIRAD